MLFHLPLVLLGFHPALVILGELSLQAYQLWIHTEVIGRLGPLDRVLNTPSNHRVHHGSDAKYLDRLTTPIGTTNPLKVWFSEFPPLFRDLRNARTWGEWWGFLLNRPGWRPTR